MISGRVLLADAAVVDVTTGAVTAHQDVSVEQGIITAITSHDPTHDPTCPSAAAADTHVVDASGRFLIPAFVDAHAHPLNHPDEVDGAHALMLAAGVTGYRQMSGSQELLERRAAGTLREGPGAPRLLALPGELLTPLNAGITRSAARTVHRQAEQGADFIKAGFTSAATFMAVLDAAREAGIPLSGHLPADLDPREAIVGGVHCIEHLGPRSALDAACCRREDQVRSLARSLPPMPPLGFLAPVLQPLLLKMVVNPSQSTDERTADAYRLTAVSFDDERAQALAELIVAQGTWNCPTLIRLRSQMLGDQREFLGDPRQRYIHPEELRAWRQASETLAQLPAGTREALAEDLETKDRLLRALDAAGAELLSGTDADGAGWVIPGLGIHDEFDLLAHAGLAPLRILQMATSDAARFFDRTDRAGRVAVGCDADLVLLDQDPTSDHRALHAIGGVMRDGAWYARHELDETLERLAAHPTAR